MVTQTSMLITEMNQNHNPEKLSLEKKNDTHMQWPNGTASNASSGTVNHACSDVQLKLF